MAKEKQSAKTEKTNNQPMLFGKPTGRLISPATQPPECLFCKRAQSCPTTAAKVAQRKLPKLLRRKGSRIAMGKGGREVSLPVWLGRLDGFSLAMAEWAGIGRHLIFRKVVGVWGIDQMRKKRQVEVGAASQAVLFSLKKNSLGKHFFRSKSKP